LRGWVRLFAAGLAAIVAAPLAGAQPLPGECVREIHDGHRYTVCAASIDAGEVRLFLNDARGAPWGGFDPLSAALAARGERLVFAMNAGMYHPDRRPVGLYVEDRREGGRLVTSAGPGNFGMLPNGVFCVGAARFDVIESRRFAETPVDCVHATQSGPMLLIDGALHPRFLQDATSRLVRNGVGASVDGQTAYFVISDSSVTFHEFARIFRDALGLRDALYLDGNVSRLYAPAIGRSGRGGRALGPIVGLVEPAAN
jgi:uncharacterized protein YigE (DUF2233 family)